MKTKHTTITGNKFTAINLDPSKANGWVIVSGTWNNGMSLTIPMIVLWDRTIEQARDIVAA